ncbi:MAG: lytic transglycosylase domain-containing protein [Acidobacteriota bacterium]
MASDSSLWRLQLGEATNSLRHILLKAAVPACLLLAVSTTRIEARTEPLGDSSHALSASFQAHERLTGLNPLVSLSPPSVVLDTAPAVQWSNRIQLPIPDHPSIERFIRFYEGRGRLTFNSALERSWYYLPIMADILESFGVPAELASVVLVESRFKGKASYRGAGGFWQLLAPTARTMGLRVDAWVDERRDPVKSTQAAAKYLRSFYDKFGSWPLAIAAYNAGDGSVARAMRRCEGGDFWDLCRSGGLPGRTKEYVPKVLAAVEVYRNLEKYGFDRPKTSPVYDCEPIWINLPLRLEQVAGRSQGPVRSGLRGLPQELQLVHMKPRGAITY